MYINNLGVRNPSFLLNGVHITCALISGHTPDTNPYSDMKAGLKTVESNGALSGLIIQVASLYN